MFQTAARRGLLKISNDKFKFSLRNACILVQSRHQTVVIPYHRVMLCTGGQYYVILGMIGVGYGTIGALAMGLGNCGIAPGG